MGEQKGRRRVKQEPDAPREGWGGQGAQGALGCHLPQGSHDSCLLEAVSATHSPSVFGLAQAPRLAFRWCHSVV